jgi:hypothetical protein
VLLILPLGDFMIDLSPFGCYFAPAMTHEKFSIRIPAELVKALDGEAGRRFRNRNQLIIDIFTERYHAPPVTPIRSSKSRNGHKGNRKTKAEVS